MFGLLPGPAEFTPANIEEDQLAIHVAQVFDLLDFGYRGVSSHETASLGSASYYTAGFEGSDTVAGSRMLLRYYNGAPGDDSYKTNIFECGHGATSVPAAEHSTITSWADVSATADHVVYEAAEYNAFRNMIKQYMPSYAVSLVSDGFNIWHAVSRLWPSTLVPPDGGLSMREMIKQRLEAFQLTLIRPDSGEGVETLPHLMTILNLALPEHFDSDLKPLVPAFPNNAEAEAKYTALVAKIRTRFGMSDGSNPFRRFKGQQMRVLQGDGVALDTVGDMLASLLSNGFCANTVHFGSGGGLLQKLNRDSLAFAFKCCAMYVGDKMYPVGKDPIAGGKKSYGGNPAVVRVDGVLINRPVPMTTEEFRTGVEGDQLVKVFESGNILVEMNFSDIQKRAKITAASLDAATLLALDNMAFKFDFFQTMSTDEAIAVRLAEASCGSKWSHTHTTHLAELRTTFPKYDAVFTKLGFTNEMTSTDVLAHIKANYVCEKAASKAILKAVGDNKAPDEIKALMGSKHCVTL
jgi:nicotinamide phosphoribosyltransferase